MNGTLLSLDCEIKMRYCFIKTLFIGEPERYIKEVLERGKSVYRGPVREPGGGFFYRGI